MRKTEAKREVILGKVSASSWSHRGVLEKKLYLNKGAGCSYPVLDSQDISSCPLCAFRQNNSSSPVQMQDSPLNVDLWKQKHREARCMTNSCRQWNPGGVEHLGGTLRDLLSTPYRHLRCFLCGGWRGGQRDGWSEDYLEGDEKSIWEVID